MNTFKLTPTRKALALCASVLACFMAASGLGVAQQMDLTKAIDFEQNLGAQLPMDTPLKDESGAAVKLGDMFQGRPVILVPISFKCQSACALVIDGLIKNLAAMTKRPKFYIGQSHYAMVGRDVDIVMISIDPRETPADAATKKKLITDAYRQPGTEPFWHLLTGTQADVAKITGAIGEKFYYDGSKGVLSNPTGIVIATPTGKISSYLLGTDYTASVLTSDFQIATRNQVGHKVEKVMFVCFQPDPASAKNRKLIEGIVSGASALTFVGLAAFIFSMCLKERRDASTGDSATSPR